MLRRLLIASLAARRSRALWGFLAVTLGVGVATTLAALSIEIGDDLARSLRASGPNFVVRPAGASWPLEAGGETFAPARAGLSLAADDVARLKTSFWRNNVLGAAPELASITSSVRAPAAGLRVRAAAGKKPRRSLALFLVRRGTPRSLARSATPSAHRISAIIRFRGAVRFARFGRRC